MKYFLLLVQERGPKIPALVWEVVALAAAAAPPPPYLSVVLHEKFDFESRCIAPRLLLSDMGYPVTCSPIFDSLAPPISAILLGTSALLPFSCTLKGKKEYILPKETQPSINEGFVAIIHQGTFQKWQCLHWEPSMAGFYSFALRHFPVLWFGLYNVSVCVHFLLTYGAYPF